MKSLLDKKASLYNIGQSKSELLLPTPPQHESTIVAFINVFCKRFFVLSTMALINADYVIQKILFFEKDPPLFYFVVMLLGFIFVCLATFLSMFLIYKHLKYYTQPEHQRYIVRIIFIIPIFGIYSLLCMAFYKHKVYFQLFRDCYESYALYMFFVLCVQYGGGDESLTRHFLTLKSISLPLPFSCIKFKPTESFLQICRVGILQYFHDYSLIINNLSVTTAMTIIVLFYQASAEELSPYKPLLKFVSIKLVIFLSFWQSLAIAVINLTFHWIPSIDHFESEQVANIINNLLICFEMMGISFLHLYAFPYELYRVKSICTAPLVHNIQRGTLLRNVINSVSQRDMLNETKNAIKGSTLLSKSFLGPQIGIDDYIDPEFQVDAIEMGDFISYQTGTDEKDYDDDSIMILDGASTTTIVDSGIVPTKKSMYSTRPNFTLSSPQLESISVDEFFDLIEKKHDELLLHDPLDYLDDNQRIKTNARR
ncbi:hypothetical protein DFA_00268 [Cavenderia fasciculata]|uniref:Transmembrane protein n=1 Tax=Cavenderia fasciculata TaxID=261658 RepID=F4PY30_CACFS|nr:uncharacterized protein DFA_00268 [Cavenderia fasciculata]EGG19690.1 hypothetical protein DFA_00268 [Cavenderia fasciculata]|eukprot:XP_004357984.1 hypothetical protein DFA_00268 [Cavenderia fasciculata]